MHYRHVTLALAFALSLLPPSVLRAQGPEEERIRNGGFESGALAPGWQLAGAVPFDGGVTDSQAHSGTYSIELRQADFIEQLFAPATVTYGTLTLWLMSGTAFCQGEIVLSVEFADAPTRLLLLNPYCTPQWTEVSFELGSADVTKVYLGSLDERVFIDDVSLKGPPPPETVPPPETTTVDEEGRRGIAGVIPRLCNRLFRGNQPLCILGAILATLAGLAGLFRILRYFR